MSYKANSLSDFISKHMEAQVELLKLQGEIEDLADVMIDTFKNGKKVLIAGNGGSYSDSSHWVGELVGRYKTERPGLAAIALSSDSCVNSAWANDYNFDTLIERQVQSLGQRGDLLIGLSTSGNSNNIIKAFEYANDNGIKTACLSGKDGGEMKGMCNFEIIVPSDDTPVIQNCHNLVYHHICDIIDQEMS